MSGRCSSLSPGRGRAVIERLSPQDLITLWPDEVGCLQDMGVVATVGGRGPVADGGLLVDAVRARLGSRLHLAPRLRQVVHVPPPGLGRPLWLDAPAFDLADHVRVHPLAPPGNEAELLATVEGLRRRRLDPSRPLWQLWLLPGLSGDRIGVYVRVHHALADGSAAVALLAALLDAVPDPAVGLAAPGASWVPAPPPTGGELFVDNLRRAGAGLGDAITVCGRPRVLLRRARGAGSACRHACVEGLAPRSSLNRPIGPDRRLAIVRSDFDHVRDAARRHGATVNDILLDAVAGGLRELLRGRGEEVAGLTLRAWVPVALPHRREERLLGNALGEMIVPLPLGVADPVRRLGLIAGETAELRRTAGRRRAPVLRSRALQRAAMTIAAHQRAANVYVANVHGPVAPMYLAGAPVLEVAPVVPLLGNFTLGVGALSYVDQFTVMAVGDRSGCPDLPVFIEAVDADLQTLTSVRPARTW